MVLVGLFDGDEEAPVQRRRPYGQDNPFSHLFWSRHVIH